MPSVVLALAVFPVGAVCAAPSAESVLKSLGYRDVKVLEIASYGIRFQHSGGIKTVYFKDLDSKIQTQFSYNPTVAKIDLAKKEQSQPASKVEEAPSSALIKNLFANRIPVTATVSEIGETTFVLMAASYVKDVTEYKIEKVQVDGPSALSPGRELRYEEVTKPVKSKKTVEFPSSITCLGDIRGKYKNGDVIKIVLYPADVPFPDGVRTVYDVDINHVAKLVMQYHSKN